MNGTNGNEPGYPEKALVPYPVILAATKGDQMCIRDSKSTIQENKGFNRTVISITSWEFHPGMVLNDVYKRQRYGNRSFGSHAAGLQSD